MEWVLALSPESGEPNTPQSVIQNMEWGQWLDIPYHGQCGDGFLVGEGVESIVAQCIFQIN